MSSSSPSSMSRSTQGPERPRSIPETFREITGQKLNRFKTMQELEAYLQSRPAEDQALLTRGVNKEILKSHIERGIFKKLLIDLPKGVLKTTYNVATAPLRFAYRHPFLTAAGVILLTYFGLGGFERLRKIVGGGGAVVQDRIAGGGAHVFPPIEVLPGNPGTQMPPPDAFLPG